jgi:hypothetical protein
MRKWSFLPLLLLTLAGYGQVYNADTIETTTEPKLKALTSITISSNTINIKTEGKPEQYFRINPAAHPMKNYTTWYTNDGASLAYDESQKMLVVTQTGKDFTAYHHLRLVKP